MPVTFKNRPSPRPGFTYVARERARAEGPVVVIVSDMSSTTALRRAAAEAAMRSVPLHVLDTSPSGSSVESAVESVGTEDYRARASGLSILHNPNVTVAHLDVSETAGEDVADYCSLHGASLLVVDQGAYEDSSQPVGLRGEQAGLDCDLLVVHAQRHG